MVEVKMAEKSAAKQKDQGKNKTNSKKQSEKQKQNDKKKNQENGLKHVNEQSVHYSNNTNQKKKDKTNKNLNKSSGKKKSVSGSYLRRFFLLFILFVMYTFLFVGFFYLVDYDRYLIIKNGCTALVDKAVSHLPEEVVVKGKVVVSYIWTGGEFAVDKLKWVAGHMSNFLNTNPALKDHWANIRDISSITSARMLEYVRTLYSHVTGVFLSGKK